MFVAYKYRMETIEYQAFASSPAGYFQNIGEEALKVGHQLKDFIVSCKVSPQVYKSHFILF